MRTRIILLVVAIVISDGLNYGSADTDEYVSLRKAMVEKQIHARGIEDQKVLTAMSSVARHHFVPERLKTKAYVDSPLPIGEGQTISQPYIVALMSAELGLDGSEQVLEIGTGSGYQAAVLSHLAASVYSMEIKPKLYEKAMRVLKKQGYTNIKTVQGDGYFGWPEKAPFDDIMITAAVNHIPPPLLDQLKEGGHLILPLGNPFGYQNLVLVTKKKNDYTVKQITGVLFVPLSGHALEKK
jgi:protein-L-isoaspartate(D-aspartate) O-methyltransferase